VNCLSNIQKILQAGESKTVEFKTSFGKEAIETLVAFANSQGGTVYVGINDTPEIIGVTISSESLQQWINQIKSVTSPSVIPDADILKYNEKNIVRLQVPAYPVKPVSTKGKYFTRKHGSNHLMSLPEIANEHLKTINLSWDFATDPNHTLNDISLEKVNHFVKMTNSLRERPITDDPLTVLRKFELTRDHAITFGCFLLFCTEPTLTTTIDAGRFDSETIIKDNITIRGDIFSELEVVLSFIRKHISKRFIITGKAQRNEVWEYPLEAIRELALNMIVHRDYRASADSTIKIFNDRIEFYNPGALPHELSLDDILSGKSPSVPRNKLIASIFKEAGIIEKYGSGIKRVQQAMQDAGALPPVFEIIGDFFKVTLTPINEGANEGVSEGVSEGVNMLYSFILDNPGNRTPFFSKELKTSTKTIERWLKQLKENKQVEFRGAPKNGGYFPLEISGENG